MDDATFDYLIQRGDNATSVSYTPNHNVSNAQNSWKFQVIIQVPNAYVDFTWSTNDSTSNQVWIDVEVVASSNTAPSAGLMRTIRPASAGLWVEWVGPMIENAGMISCALSPARGIFNLIGTAGSSPFRPAEYESYVQLQSGRDGRVMTERRLDKGCFLTWDSAREDDVSLKSYTDEYEHHPPVLFAAGKYSVSTGTPPAGGILRCHCAVNFEYETTSRAVVADQNDMAYADGQASIRNLRAELGIPYCMENDLHDVATRFAQAMLTVVEFNAKMVGTALKAAGVKSLSVGPLKLGFGGE